MKSAYFIVYLLVASVMAKRGKPKPNTLKLVQVIFRHAQRTPDPATIYPQDPFKDCSYEPFGLGEMTKEGFKTQYEMGRALRTRYGTFIGNYSPRTSKAMSSPYSRTKIATQLVLAGLFPPTGERDWNSNLKWQPIDFETNPKSTDLIFLPQLNCKNFLALLEEAILKAIKSNKFPILSKISEYATNHSGWDMRSPSNAFLLYSGLLSEEEWGLQLPNWTQAIYPEPLKSIAVDFVSSMAEDERMITLSAGFLLKKLSEELKMKMDEIGDKKDIRISLYGGHDFNIISLLSALGVYKPHLPPYAAYVLIELHLIDNQYGVKVFYNDYTKMNPELMVLPGCGSFCPLDKFFDMYSKYFATGDMCISPEYIRS